jgi:hypothetical protein
MTEEGKSLSEIQQFIDRKYADLQENRTPTPLPPAGVLLRPEWAALAMSVSTVTVTLNALLLNRVRFERERLPASAGDGRPELLQRPRAPVASSDP